MATEMPALKIMNERIHISNLIGILLAVPPRFKQRGWLAILPVSESPIMHDRVHPRFSDIRILLEVPRRIEERIRATTFAPSVVYEMFQRIDIGTGDVRIYLQVPIQEEKARFQD